MTTTMAIAGVIFAAAIALILSERVHRTIISLVGASAMLAFGMLTGFYTQHQALEAIDFNTLGLLMGMMVMVGLLQQTGFFQYIAILLGKRSRGKPWLLLIILAAATSVLSMFLDNVTTVVLIVPVSILIAELLGITPVPLLMAEALLSNIGGMATLVGDPPNVLIGSAAGLTFGAFLEYLAPLALVAWGAALAVLLFVFRRELVQPALNAGSLSQLDEQRALTDPINARKILIVLGLMILFFFLEGPLGLEPATIALSGAGLALLWVRPDVDGTLRHVEWSVLLFFAGLFVMTGGLRAAGLLGLVARSTVSLAIHHPLLASLTLFWVAAILSALVDNIPFTVALIPVILELGTLGVNVRPLWWALALGAGLGGNGTPIGATANVVTVALSSRTHTPITLRIWLRSGLPVTLVTCVLISALFALLFHWLGG
ncbi:MAG: ArsB/NhaD family transporter [Anaerolineae bacterium]|nr:ArsB/NhaD family transporter [Anaerolineae bacterium]